MTQSDLQANLREIAVRLFSGHAAVMIGSGVSKQATPITTIGKQFPIWSELADILRERAYGRLPGNNEHYLDALKLAEQVEARFGRSTLNQIIKESIPDRQYTPSKIHKKILELPWSDVFTTNYDTLLERASDSVVSRRYDIVVKSEDLVYSTKPRIVKLHGSLPAHTPFIITEEDYRTYPTRHAPFVNTVRQSLLENTICLIGFSGSDPNFFKWIGWIRDNLGQESPKIYFIQVHSISDSERILLERRGITALDISRQAKTDTKTGEVLEWFVDQIRSKSERNKSLTWPKVDSNTQQNTLNNTTSQLLETIERWRAQRLQFPGWIVVPHDRRTDLWSETSNHIAQFGLLKKLPYAHGLKCAFELVWRLEKCLCPILDQQLADIENLLLESQNEETVEANSNNPNIQKDDSKVDQMRHYLMLSLLRHYREKGDGEKWKNMFDQLERLFLCSDHMEKLYYERSLYALFNQDTEELKLSLIDWRVERAESTAPFWLAKKASILAEVGSMDQANSLLQKALTVVRRNLNLSPARHDYTLLSQESIIMLLMHYVELSISIANAEQYGRSDELQSRVHDLKAYKCDPAGELNLFLRSLNGPANQKQKVGEISEPAFDIRSIRTQYRWEQWNEPVMEALQFLRFCEDTGIPFTMPHLNIAGEGARNAVSRVSHYFPFWAMASLTRIGDQKAIEEYFNRSTLASIPATQVELLVNHYVHSLGQSVQAENSTVQNYKHTLAKTIPEILSRLCCKCSPQSRRQILFLVLAIYKARRKINYEGIKELFRRLLQAMSSTELNESLSILVGFPILSNSNNLESQKFVNPFLVILENEQYRLLKGTAEINESDIRIQLESATSEEESERAWAITTLCSLYLADLLDKDVSNNFATALWSQVDEFGLPKGTGLYPSVYLKLPKPKGIDVSGRFKEWVNQAEFPIVGDSKSYTLTGGRSTICSALISSRNLVHWDKNEIDRIFTRLVSWWDADKNRLVASEEDEALLLPSSRREFKKRFLVWRNVLVQVVLPNLKDGRIDVLRRLVIEYSDRRLPVLHIKAASLDLVPEWRDDVFREIRLMLDSPDLNYCIDSLRALILLCRQFGSEEAAPGLSECVLSAAYLVRFGEADALRAALDGLAELFRNCDWTISPKVEQIVLERLDRLHTLPSEMVGEHEFLKELYIRICAAKLACVLFDWHTSRKEEIPAVLHRWQEICQSSEEFAEIRNAWGSEGPS